MCKCATFAASSSEHPQSLNVWNPKQHKTGAGQDLQKGQRKCTQTSYLCSRFGSIIQLPVWLYPESAALLLWVQNKYFSMWLSTGVAPSLIIQPLMLGPTFFSAYWNDQSPGHGSDLAATFNFLQYNRSPALLSSPRDNWFVLISRASLQDDSSTHSGHVRGKSVFRILALLWEILIKV